jgi:hypothetical protein
MSFVVEAAPAAEANNATPLPVVVVDTPEAEIRRRDHARQEPVHGRRSGRRLASTEKVVGSGVVAGEKGAGQFQDEVSGAVGLTRVVQTLQRAVAGAPNLPLGI